MLPDSQNLHGEKKKETLVTPNEIILYYARFASCEITQAELLVARRGTNWQIGTYLCLWERLRS